MHSPPQLLTEAHDAITALTQADATAWLAARDAELLERVIKLVDDAAADAKNDNGTGWASHSWLKTVARMIETMKETKP